MNSHISLCFEILAKKKFNTLKCKIPIKSNTDVNFSNATFDSVTYISNERLPARFIRDTLNEGTRFVNGRNPRILRNVSTGGEQVPRQRVRYATRCSIVRTATPEGHIVQFDFRLVARAYLRPSSNILLNGIMILIFTEGYFAKLITRRCAKRLCKHACQGVAPLYRGNDNNIIRLNLISVTGISHVEFSSLRSAVARPLACLLCLCKL